MIDSNDSQQDPRKTVPKRISVRTERKEAQGNNTAQKVADRNTPPLKLNFVKKFILEKVRPQTHYQPLFMSNVNIITLEQ